ncbi:MAG: hypothetical protein H6R19_2644 [Proteobacteria bacterium]|nr:hypothetical protein [Pseudomonadota bacterium]
MLTASSGVNAASGPEEVWRQSAPADGWAGMEGGTTGGAKASAEQIYTVRDIDGLRAALKKGRDTPKIVVIEGIVDAAGSRPFESREDQAERGQIRLPSNTTLIGADKNAGFINADLVLRHVENVIVRNLMIQNPWDEYPQWDPKDGPTGHWNSEYDGMTIDGSRHVWVDHVSFSDGSRTDDQNGTNNGHEVQHHDGALDVKNAADFITVSYSVFRLHDKNNLIGHSDSNQSDAGHLRVTFHHNLFQSIVQRTPRVRYGQVHLYNNHYVGDRKDPVYAYQYSHGVGVGASLISENEVFDIAGANSLCDVVKFFGGTRYEARGNLLNGKILSPDAACKGALKPEAAGWTPPYAYTLLPAKAVASSVKETAGPL